MGWNALRILSALVAVANASPAAAAAPAGGKDIPVYPGATRDAQAEREEDASQVGDGPPTSQGPSGSRWFRIYASGAAPEDVFRFYEKSLGAKLNDGSWDGAPPPIGGATPVRYTLTLRETGDLEPRIRAAIAKDRRPLRDGKWLGEAMFEWERLSAKGAPTECFVRVTDPGAEGETYRRATRVEHSCVSGDNPEVVQERELGRVREQRGLERNARVAQLAAKPPTEKELGVPIYPGARFQPKVSAGIVSPGSVMYVFTSDDRPAKVASFYEKVTGKKAGTAPEVPDTYMFPITGNLPLPEEHVAVTPNTLIAPARGAAIWIQRNPR